MSESTLEREGFPEAGDTEVTVGATGQELREHREALGANLSDVSDILRIRRDFLEALESGQYDALPGEAYAVGFVRSYAKYLGLDADAMARQFKVELTGERPTARLDFLTPAAESRVPTAAIVFVAVLLVIAVYGLWYFFNARDVSVSNVVPEPPASLAGTTAPTTPPPGTEAPAASTAAQADPAKQGGGSKPAPSEGPLPAGGDTPAGQASQAGPASATPETPTANAGAAAPPKPGAQPEARPATPESPALSSGPARQAQATASQGDAAAQAAASKPPTPAPVPPARRPAAPDQRPDQRLASAVPPKPAAPPARPADKLALPRIVLRAKSDSWVEVRTATGDLVISRVLTQGTTYSVPPRPGLKLTTGNAGGLEILVDGVALPPLGAAGRVRRDIALDPDRLKSRAAGRSR